MLAKFTRLLVRGAVFFLPEHKKIAIDRRLRGREEFHKLQQADCVIVSYGKSGRTWLRVMLSRFYQLKHGLPDNSLIGFDNLHAKNPAIPLIFFTHDNYLKDFTGHADSKKDYYQKKVVLLVRDPRDAYGVSTENIAIRPRLWGLAPAIQPFSDSNPFWNPHDR